jgi:hypothetical protein
MKKKVNWKTLILGTIIFWIGFAFWYRDKSTNMPFFQYPNIYIELVFYALGYVLMFLGIGIILKDAPD